MKGSYGTWKPDVSRCEALVESVRSSGVPEHVCTIENIAQSRTTVSRDGDNMTILTSFPGIPDREIKFKPGEEFEVDTPNGKAKCNVTEEENRVVENIVLPTGDTIKIVRQMEGEDMKVTINAHGKTYIQYLVKC